jgi:hypothetical protein
MTKAVDFVKKNKLYFAAAVAAALAAAQVLGVEVPSFVLDLVKAMGLAAV